jgi:6-phosphogluconolactonase
MKHNLHVFENAVKTAQAVAELISEAATEKKRDSKPFNIAVSGGNTPRELFAFMADEYKDLIPWETIRIFWVDERCVEPNHPDSNFGMTHDNLLYQPFIPSTNVFRMKGEEFPEDEALRYKNLLWKELPVKHGFPVFDLVLLGVGFDGHTASIFPDNLALIDSEYSVAVTVQPETKQKRLTLTAKVINNAEKVVFMVTGENKSSIIADIITKTEKAKKYPASYIHGSKGKVDFYLDEGAASLL